MTNATQTFTCDGCGDEWTRPTARGQRPRWCPECRPKCYTDTWCQRCGERTRQHARFCSWICANLERFPDAFRPGSAVVLLPISERHRRRMPAPPNPPTATARFTGGACCRCGSSVVVDRAAGYNGLNRYCSRSCAKADGRDRRRALKRSAMVAPVYRHRIFTRDGWRCQLCGRKVHRTKSVPHDRAPTIDHIIPLALGGTHEPANCQTACFLCNATKSAHGYGDQLRLIG